MLLAVAGCAAAPAQDLSPAGSSAHPGSGAAPPAAAPAPTRPAGLRPVAIRIPAIGVEESVFESLHLMPSGELAAPVDFDRIGWYAEGAVPGEPGPAVIAGHVDSKVGPAVFYRLRDLRAGDEITVHRSDGELITFRVDGVRRYPKAEFATAEVYGPVPGAALRLITCGGSFDRSARSYRDNIVVFASRNDLPLLTPG